MNLIKPELRPSKTASSLGHCWNFVSLVINFENITLGELNSMHLWLNDFPVNDPLLVFQ